MVNGTSSRRVEKDSTDKLLSDGEVEAALRSFFAALYSHGSDSESSCANNAVRPPAIDDVCYPESLQLMRRALGFTVEKRPSRLVGAGTGVIVTSGSVPCHAVVAMYPGTIYYPWQPILLQSIANPFVFRCIDSVCIDGNDKGLSRVIHKSCANRDRIGPYRICDPSWMTTQPVNPLAIGQYVNNHNKENPANVAYQEFHLPLDFPLHLRRFLPNVNFGSNIDGTSGPLRTIVLVTLREISLGEELFSSYFTVVS